MPEFLLFLVMYSSLPIRTIEEIRDEYARFTQSQRNVTHSAKQVDDGSHPCEWGGCKENVQYDDEPYCYTHSPDSGSSRVGYSYREKVASGVVEF